MGQTVLGSNSRSAVATLETRTCQGSSWSFSYLENVAFESVLRRTVADGLSIFPMTMCGTQAFLLLSDKIGMVRGHVTHFILSLQYVVY